MSEWISRIRDHRIWALMKDFGPIIDRAVRLDDIDPALIEGLERLRSILTLCGKRIGGSDPVTILPTTLDTIASGFESAKAEIDAFTNDLNPNHITSANSSADGVLVALALVPGIATSEELVGLIETVASHRAGIERQAHSFSEFRSQARAGIQELKSEIESFTAQAQSSIADLRSQLEIERQKISSQASEQQKTFADAQEIRSNTYNETLRKIQDNLSQTLTDHQRQFSDAQENRNREFTTAQTESQKRLADLLGEYTKSLADQDAGFTQQRHTLLADSQKRLEEVHADYLLKASSLLEQVNKRKEEIETLVGVIGNLGVTSGYVKTANSARKSMWFWQSVTVAALVAVIWFAYHAFLPTMQGDFKWGGFATRVFLTITVGVLAAYAVSQADRFFQIEKYNRKLALELAAIDPFIALLPQDEQHKFKLEVGRRSFGQDDVSGAAKSDKSPATALDVLLSKEGQQTLQVLADLVQKALKKA